MQLHWAFLALLALLIALPLIQAATTATTLFVWNVPASTRSYSITYAGTCSATDFYFNETDANFDSDIDGNSGKVPPSSSSTGASSGICQTQVVAPMLITNTGSLDINMDGNFSAAFSGADANIVLKVWEGTGSGCGTGGFGGWEKDCSTTGALNDLTSTQCRQYNRLNATANGRLVTRLLAGDTNQLCFSGDLNTFTLHGTYAKTFQIGDFNS